MTPAAEAAEAWTCVSLEVTTSLLLCVLAARRSGVYSWKRESRQQQQPAAPHFGDGWWLSREPGGLERSGRRRLH